MIDQSIQHYKILEKIGEGGMGVVYKAEDTRLKRTVALKFLPPHLTKDEEAKTRFITEAQAASSLDHQNICTVHQIDETDDEQMYIVMAYYEGETLDKKIERNLPKVLNLREVIDIASQIAAGLARAHEAGITHRDIKPSNIMITKRGEVKILDFGIARIAGQKAITKTDSTLGTVAYMSPEQVKGEPVDHRTDIWSLGVVLYEMLTGQRPFDAEYDQAVMYRIVNEKPAALSKYLDSPNPAIEIFVNQLMEKDLNKRLQTIHDTEHRLHILTKNSNQSQTLSPIVENVPLSNKLIRPTLFVIGIIIAIFLIITLASNDPEKSVISFGVENWITRNNNAYNAYPKWAPNNNILAYHSNVSGNWDIWTGIPGGGMRLRQNRTADFTSDDLYPSWSHDGKRVFFGPAAMGAAFIVLIIVVPYLRNWPGFRYQNLKICNGHKMVLKLRTSGTMILEIQ
ncbi:MAG: protein kinase [bacterium]